MNVAPPPAAASPRRPLRAVLLLLLLPLAPALLSAWLHPRRPDWAAPGSAASEPAPGRVRLEELVAREAPRLWVDARPADEFARGHVPGALPLVEERWEELFPELIGAWDGRSEIVVYCGAASCRTSEAVARRLRAELGFEQVFVLEGGWDALSAANPGRASP